MLMKNGLALIKKMNESILVPGIRVQTKHRKKSVYHKNYLLMSD